MSIHVLHGPNCHGTAIVRHGQTRQGKHRSGCHEQRGAGRTCRLEDASAGPSPEVKQPMVAMAMHASSMRDPACDCTAVRTRSWRNYKKASHREHVTHTGLQGLHPEHGEGEMCRSEALEYRRGRTSELDAMWRDGRRKAHPRWVWHAIEHPSGPVFAYGFGRRQATVFAQFIAVCSSVKRVK